MLDNPAFNLNTSNKSAVLYHSSSDHNPSLCSLSLKHNFLKSGNSLEKRCWTFSRRCLSFW